jgi:hypothetical protein
MQQNASSSVVDALPLLINDARIRAEAAYRAGADEHGSAHFARFLDLWSTALKKGRPA